MRIFLNERSFPERSPEPDKIFSILRNLTMTAGIAKTLANNQHIRRHRELKNKEVLNGKSLHEYIVDLAGDPDPQKRKVMQTFLELFAKGPFLTGCHLEKDKISDLNGSTCLKSSCFDDASACRTGAAVISIETPSQSEEHFFDIVSSIYGVRRILNITNVKRAVEMQWIYEGNLKHAIPKDVCVAGETYSAMKLSKEDAQRVLSNGIKIGKCVFNKVGEQWYKFHRHEKNLYHGFPITISTPYKEFSAARILFEEISVNEDGQLLEELLEIRSKK